MTEPTHSAQVASRDPSVCMPTWSRFNRHAYQSPRYESQDVLAQVCDLDLLAMEADGSFDIRQRWLRRLVWKDPTGLLAFSKPGLVPVTPKRDYDVFIVVCQTLKELMFVNAIRTWRERCRTCVCIIDELYAAEVAMSRNFLTLLRDFDHVFTEFSGSAAAIGQIIGRPCRSLPPAVDAARFTPWPNPPARTVNVHSIGRRRPGPHEQLLKMTESGLFYVYDVFESGAEARVLDHRTHRDLIANIAKRSEFFMVAPAKWNVPQETRGQIAIANRYFEGAAAGAILIGQPSDTDEFRALFDWPDSVVSIREDGSDIQDVIMALHDDPARMNRISRRNAAEALRRHDWSYRWRSLFEQIGVAPGPSMLAREQRLGALADDASSQST